MSLPANCNICVDFWFVLIDSFLSSILKSYFRIIQTLLRTLPSSCVVSTQSETFGLEGDTSELNDWSVSPSSHLCLILGIPYPLLSLPFCWAPLSFYLFTIFKSSNWLTGPYPILQPRCLKISFLHRPLCPWSASSTYSSNFFTTNLIICVSIYRILPGRVACCVNSKIILRLSARPSSCIVTLTVWQIPHVVVSLNCLMINF